MTNSIYPRSAPKIALGFQAIGLRDCYKCTSSVQKHMVRLACFGWKPRGQNESDQKLLENVMPQGVADLDQNGNAIPGGLAGIRQRMAAMGHTMNPQADEDAHDPQVDWTENQDLPVAKAKSRRGMPAHGVENMDGNSGEGFSLTVDVCTDDGSEVKAGRLHQNFVTRREPAPKVDESGARGIILAGSKENLNAAQSSSADNSDPNNLADNLLETKEQDLVAPDQALPSVDPATSARSEIIHLDGSAAHHNRTPSNFSSIPSGSSTQSQGPFFSLGDGAGKQPRKFVASSKSGSGNFLLDLASIETTKNEEAEPAQKRALGQSTSNMDAVEEYFPGRDEVQKHLQVLSPSYVMGLEKDAEDEKGKVLVYLLIS